MSTAAATLAAVAVMLVGYFAATVIAGRMPKATAKPDEVYNHEAEGDFAHNPKFRVFKDIAGNPAFVVVECSLGDYAHLQPITRSVAAARLAADAEFWVTHNEEVRTA